MDWSVAAMPARFPVEAVEIVPVDWSISCVPPVGRARLGLLGKALGVLRRVVAFVARLLR